MWCAGDGQMLIAEGRDWFRLRLMLSRGQSSKMQNYQSMFWSLQCFHQKKKLKISVPLNFGALLKLNIWGALWISCPAVHRVVQHLFGTFPLIRWIQWASKWWHRSCICLQKMGSPTVHYCRFWCAASSPQDFTISMQLGRTARFAAPVPAVRVVPVRSARRGHGKMD